MERIYAVHNTPIHLGRQGEGNVREIAFDISHWQKTVGEGYVQLMVRRPGEAAMYPVVLIQEGGYVVWTVSAADVAIAGQSGECELSYTPSAARMAKSEVWRTYVSETMGMGEVTPPVGAQSWIDQVRKETAEQKAIAEEAEQSAGRAAESAGQAATRAVQAEQHAKAAGKNAELAAGSEKNAATSLAEAENARKAIENMTVEAVGLAAGESAAIRKELVSGAVKLIFGIPRGERGEKGAYPDITESVKGMVLTAGENGLPVWQEAPESLPEGGTEGQVLTKKSGADGDAEWADLPSGLPDVTEEDDGKVLQVASGKWSAMDAPSGGDESVFVAIYGETTFAEVLDAYNAGKFVVCRENSGTTYHYLYYLNAVWLNNRFTFALAEAQASSIGSITTDYGTKTVFLDISGGWKKRSIVEPSFHTAFYMRSSDMKMYKVTINSSGEFVLTET